MDMKVRHSIPIFNSSIREEIITDDELHLLVEFERTGEGSQLENQGKRPKARNIRVEEATK